MWIIGPLFTVAKLIYDEIKEEERERARKRRRNIRLVLVILMFIAIAAMLYFGRSLGISL